MPWLGAGAAVSLTVYACFLGTDGGVYCWIRRYGVSFYFGFTCLCMLVVGDATRRLVTDRRCRRRIDAALLLLCLALPLLGLTHGLPSFAPDESARDALQNAAEWWGGALSTALFALLAWVGRASGVGALRGRPSGD